MIETTKFERIPFEVEAVQVTEENLEEVASWCDGSVNRKRRDKKPFVEVKVVNPRIEPRNAFVGDWVLRATKGFKVYNAMAFQKCFRRPLGDHVEHPEALRRESDRIKHIAHRSATTGEFVTADYATAHPDTTVEEQV